MIPRSRRTPGRRWIAIIGLAFLGGEGGQVLSADAEPAAPESPPIKAPRDEPREIPRMSAPLQPNPLRGTPAIKPETTGVDASGMLDTLLPGRSDSPFDWHAPVEPLHRQCEPLALPACVPPPPCHPSAPPHPEDLIGVRGCPSGGPIYRGPCEPRSGTPHAGPFAWYHRLHDRFVDHFYKWK